MSKSREARFACIDTLSRHDHYVHQVAVSPDGRRVASSGLDKKVVVWELLPARSALSRMDCTPGSPVCFFRDASHLLFSLGGLRLVRVSDRAVLQLYNSVHCKEPRAVSVSGDGRLIAAGGGENVVVLWASTTGAVQHTFRHHTYPVNSVAFSPDSSLVASAGSDNCIIVNRVEDGTMLWCVLGHVRSVTSVHWAPDSLSLFTASSDSTIKQWEASAGALLQKYEGHSKAVFCAVTSPGGEVLASAGTDNTIRVWRTATGECLQVLKAHHDSVSCLAFSPDGHWFVSGSNDNTIKVWETQSVMAAKLLAQVVLVSSGEYQAKVQPGAERFFMIGGRLPNELKMRLSCLAIGANPDLCLVPSHLIEQYLAEYQLEG